MKTLAKILAVMMILGFVFTSCEEDEANELSISFYKANGYVYSDTTVSAGSSITIGVRAKTSKPTDPLIRFIVTGSVNGGTVKQLYYEDINTAEYDHDFKVTLDSTQGLDYKFIFTIINKDGLTAQKSLHVKTE